MFEVEQWWFWQTSYVPSGIREVLQDPAVLTCITTAQHWKTYTTDLRKYPLLCVSHYTKYECEDLSLRGKKGTSRVHLWPVNIQ